MRISSIIIQSVVLLAALVLTPVAGAQSHSSSCDLERARIEVQAAPLALPAMFASVGEANVLNERTATVGVRWSPVGMFRAQDLRAAAEAKCTAQEGLEEASMFLDTVVQHARREGAVQSLPKFDIALMAAEKHVTWVSKSVAAGSATLTQQNEARSVVRGLVTKRVEMQALAEMPAVQLPKVSMTEKIQQAVRAEAKYQTLVATAAANAAWDVSVSAGSRHRLNGERGSEPFVGVTMQWSFGQPAAAKAARQLGALVIANEQRYSSSSSAAARLAQTLTAQVRILSSRVEQLEKHIEDVRADAARIAGVDSMTSKYLAASYEVQTLTAQAELAAARSEFVALNAWR